MYLHAITSFTCLAIVHILVLQSAIYTLYLQPPLLCVCPVLSNVCRRLEMLSVGSLQYYMHSQCMWCRNTCGVEIHVVWKISRPVPCVIELQFAPLLHYSITPLMGLGLRSNCTPQPPETQLLHLAHTEISSCIGFLVAGSAKWMWKELQSRLPNLGTPFLYKYISSCSGFL